MRQVRWREPAAYMAKALAGQAVSNETTVAAGDLPFEFMLNALRLKDGVELGLFAERTGLSPTQLDAAIDQGVQRGLLQRQGALLVPTARGFDFLSDLQQLFLGL